MQQTEINKTEQAQQAATLLMEVVPMVMNAIRSEVRRYRPVDLSVPQFRVLNFVRRYPKTSLSDVAEHVGLTLPSVSKMVDGLEERQLLKREMDGQDRRKLILTLTEHGQTTLEAVRQQAMNHLSHSLLQLSEEEQQVIMQAMTILRPIFVEKEL